MPDADGSTESTAASTSAGGRKAAGGEKPPQAGPGPKRRDPWRTFGFKSRGGLELRIEYSAEPEQDQKDPASQETG